MITFVASLVFWKCLKKKNNVLYNMLTGHPKLKDNQKKGTNQNRICKIEGQILYIQIENVRND